MSTVSEQAVASMWTEDTEALLRDWHARVYASQRAYYMRADHYRFLNYLLGIPVVIVTSVVGTTIFANLEGTVEGNWPIVVGAISVAAAVLASLQTFLRFAEQAANNGASGDWYAAIRRDIEQELAIPRQLRGDPKKVVDGIRKEMNKVAQKSPELNERMWVKIAQTFSVNEPPFPDDVSAFRRLGRLVTGRP